MAKVRFDGAWGVCVVRVASVLKSGIYFRRNRCRSLCFRNSTIIPQYMTKFAIDRVGDLPGLNVLITA